MNSVDKKLESLKYLYDHKNGYLHELLEYVSEEQIEEFRVVGFIHLGYSLKYRTWSITDLGKQFYKEIR